MSKHESLNQTIEEAAKESLEKLLQNLSALVDADEKFAKIMEDLTPFERFLVNRLGAKLPKS